LFYNEDVIVISLYICVLYIYERYIHLIVLAFPPFHPKRMGIPQLKVVLKSVINRISISKDIYLVLNIKYYIICCIYIYSVAIDITTCIYTAAAERN
jgi:hypothetical protein